MKTLRTSPKAPDFDQVADYDFGRTADPDYDETPRISYGEGVDPDYDQDFAEPDNEEASQEWYARK